MLRELGHLTALLLIKTGLPFAIVCADVIEVNTRDETNKHLVKILIMEKSLTLKSNGFSHLMRFRIT